LIGTFNVDREVFIGQTKKIPAEAVELYTRFIHGEISRRDFFNGVERFAVAGLTATAIVAALMPNYALGQQVPKGRRTHQGEL
jgi:carboxymethylenebutenolidase